MDIIMRRTISNEIKVTVEGIHDHRNCKEVYCITDGHTYASVHDAANAAGVTQGTMSYHITHKTNACKGKQYCFLNQIAENHDRIANHNRSAIENAEILREGNKTLAENLNNVTKTANEAVIILNDIRMRAAQVAETKRRIARLEAELEEAENHLTMCEANLAAAIENSANIAFNCQ
jgi:hypothetical protein